MIRSSGHGPREQKTVRQMRQVFDSKDVDAEANKLLKRKGRGKYEISEQA